MDKLAKVLNKYNKDYLFKQKTSIRQHKFYQKDLMRQDLFFEIKDDRDFINFEIIKTSYNNMRKIQDKYFEIKSELDDLWDVITYQEKHFLLYKSFSAFMDSLKHFYYQDKRYFIAYFDDLINAYYDHNMLMFDNEAYRKFLYDFKKIKIDISNYGILPIQAGFSQVDFIVGDNNNYVLYSDQVKRFYHFSNIDITYGLSQDLSVDQIKTIADLIIKKDKAGFIDYLIDNKLGNKRLLKRLKRIKRKM